MSLNVVSTGAPTACGLKHGKNQDRQVRGRCRSRRTSLLCCGHTRLARLHRCLLTFQRTACSYVCDARSACFGRFCAVFDGHGGEAAAMLAARRLLTFAEARTADSGGNAEALGRALARAFADCEHALALAAASQRSDPGGAVAVAAAVLPSAPPTLLLAWAGDATALLLRRGGAVRLTREHTLAEPSELRRVLLSGGEVVPPRTPAEAGRVKRCDANDLDHRGVPTRGIGDLQQGQPNAVISPQPEVRALPLSACDELLALVTDGVTAVLSDQARHGACLLRADACCRDNAGDCGGGGVSSARRPQGGKRSGGCCAPRPRHGRLHRGGGISRMRRRVMTRGRRGTSIMRHHLCGDLSNAWRRVMPSRPRPAAHHT